MTAEMAHVASAHSGLLHWADSDDKTTTTVHIKVATRRCQPSLAHSRHFGEPCCPLQPTSPRHGRRTCSLTPKILTDPKG